VNVVDIEPISKLCSTIKVVIFKQLPNSDGIEPVNFQFGKICLSPFAFLLPFKFAEIAVGGRPGIFALIDNDEVP